MSIGAAENNRRVGAEGSASMAVDAIVWVQIAIEF